MHPAHRGLFQWTTPLPLVADMYSCHHSNLKHAVHSCTGRGGGAFGFWLVPTVVCACGWSPTSHVGIPAFFAFVPSDPHGFTSKGGAQVV